MGKRTKEKSDDEIRKKIRRLERELQLRDSPVNEDPEYESCYEEEADLNRDPPPTVDDGQDDRLEDRQLQSVVEVVPEIPGTNMDNTSNQGEEAIPSEILAILGESKKSEETLGPNIPSEIAERWGKILVEGGAKEQKEGLLANLPIPANFLLAKAPKLNAEVTSILNEAAKNRDKRLEKMQEQLGSGIAGLANLTAELISKDLGKLEIIKKIAEVNQILLDLHYEESMNRRRLLIPMLDKSFISIIRGVKRGEFLFGDNLGENIKTSKTIEKSSLQIKKTVPPQPSTSRRPFNTGHQGNSLAPPRQAAGQGAARGRRVQGRYPPQLPAARRPPPAPRYQPPQSRPQDRRGRR